jgi:hypothetical protein
LCHEPEHAAARRKAFDCRLLNAHGGIEALLVVVPTTGYGRTTGKDERIDFQAAI